MQSKAKNWSLWVLQILLAGIFLWTGWMKLTGPLANFAGPVTLSGWSVRFLGMAEMLGAAGLVLPGLFKIWPHLTAWAAAGLAVIMLGAVILTLNSGMGVLMALAPFVIGIVAGVIVYGRGRDLQQ